eukprot:TRINITY_DN27145_c0_g1_i1.p1 TRINITY_DN27145_c0_g1~~TRINITY_DN27145_c0_g1_i1.p1  ORF type:complete len:217 (+),score=6.50 TRINITY_DN27145_c0_g1_i1:65-652(+)
MVEYAAPRPPEAKGPPARGLMAEEGLIKMAGLGSLGSLPPRRPVNPGETPQITAPSMAKGPGNLNILTPYITPIGTVRPSTPVHQQIGPISVPLTPKPSLLVPAKPINIAWPACPVGPSCTRKSLPKSTFSVIPSFLGKAGGDSSTTDVRVPSHVHIGAYKFAQGAIDLPKSVMDSRTAAASPRLMKHTHKIKPL